ncbi:MAG: zinc ABC transporter substrate-binding protein [Alphaproteobacteria bacterium]
MVLVGVALVGVALVGVVFAGVVLAGAAPAAGTTANPAIDPAIDPAGKSAAGANAFASRAARPLVVASITPIHSLAAGVMRGVGAPRLLVAGGGSPHNAWLKPSAARALAAADIVFWAGPGLEAFLGKPLAALAAGAKVVELAAVSGLRRQANSDPHVWLDPANARAMVSAMVTALAEADPANTPTYVANGIRLAKRLAALDRDLAAALAPVRAVPYVVFHDAYGHFEQRYGLANAAAVTIRPDRPPGARQARDIRNLLLAEADGRGVRCLFAEPQFAPALAARLVEGTGVRLGVLDPLGAGLAPGPEAYFTLMRRLARAFVTCLSPPG